MTCGASKLAEVGGATASSTRGPRLSMRHAQCEAKFSPFNSRSTAKRC